MKIGVRRRWSMKPGHRPTGRPKGYKWTAAQLAKRLSSAYYSMEARRERFYEKVNRIDAVCWEWLAFRNPHGYGMVGFGARAWGAHRIALVLEGVTIPPGWEVDHKCRNRGCVRPDHLQVVPPGFNGAQGVETLRRKTHCPHGHPYSGENLVRSANGGRVCWTCRKAHARQYSKELSPERRALKNEKRRAKRAEARATNAHRL